MRSIRTKTIILNVIAITISILVAPIIGVVSIANLGHSDTQQSLRLLCETGKSNLNYYFQNVEQTVDTISDLISTELDNVDDASFDTELGNLVENARFYFNAAANNTDGVFTYYYRLDPSITSTTGEKGFWYVANDEGIFEEHIVTDISDDQNECRWFYGPKNTGKSIWLSPYLTDSLNAYVLSYNTPIYRHHSFVGVVGIEIDYKTLGEQIDDIKVLDSGYAFIIENKNATIIYHPSIDLLGMKEEDRPQCPDEVYQAVKRNEHHIVYKYEGVTKHGYWLELSNEMNVIVCVPAVEINNRWLTPMLQIILAGVIVLGAFILLTILYSRHITQPLKKLTLAAEEINKGNYDVKLAIKSDDEIGVLSTTFNKLISHLSEYISDLNSMAYGDALTAVGNKGAFDVRIKELEAILSKNSKFAIAMFDCDDLKAINDQFGHDKGNVYLKNASMLIARIFKNSEVYRIGGDEFAVILENEDFNNRDALQQEFLDKSLEMCALAKEPWEHVKVSVGIATYDPEIDRNAEDVLIHADHLMYENKRERKRHAK